jgi:hypothetical protein
MIKLDARIRVGRRQKWNPKAPKEALELIKLLKDEGLVGEALGLAYHEAAVGWRRHGRPDLALSYALKELNVCILCYGTNSPVVDTTKALLMELNAEISELAVSNVYKDNCPGTL